MSLFYLRQKYKRRIHTADPAELVVINLELALAFTGQNNLWRARQAICCLAEALDFRYELSQNLYNIYTVIDKKLTAGIVNNDISAVNDAKHLISLLLDRWRDTARAQPSPPERLTQKPVITAGLTYNSKGICEYIEQDYSGGYRV